jgi:transcriptional regulator with XRE-family HTH domain
MDASQAIAIRNRIIGVLVKRARLGAGKSQRECGELLGCSPFVFSQYERGRKGMSLPQLEVLAHFLEVPAASLWDGAYPKPADPPAESPPVEQMLLLRRKVLAVQFRQCRLSAGLTQKQLGELLDCSANMISQYERGKREIPLAELEIAAEQCGQEMDSFLDDETIPQGQLEQERLQLAQLDELPPDVRDFALRPTNALYLRIAMLLSALKVDNLRQIAETLLDITY